MNMINNWNYLYSLSYINNNINQNSMIIYFDPPNIDNDNKNDKDASSPDNNKNQENTIKEEKEE